MKSGDRVRIIIPTWPDIDGTFGTVIDRSPRAHSQRWMVQCDAFGPSSDPLHLLLSDMEPAGEVVEAGRFLEEARDD